MAAKTTDYTKMMKDMLGAFPVDTSAMTEAFKTQATFADKMSKVVLDAAEKSTEISAGLTKATIGKLGVVTNVKDDPTDYTKAMTDFASAQAEMSSESMAAFAEVAKKVQRSQFLACLLGCTDRNASIIYPLDRRAGFHRCQKRFGRPDQEGRRKGLRVQPGCLQWKNQGNVVTYQYAQGQIRSVPAARSDGYADRAVVIPRFRQALS